MKNIILVGISPLVKRRLEVFYLEELMLKGFHVTHCDLSPCFLGDLHYENVLDVDYALTFKCMSSFEDYLRGIETENSIFIVEVPHSSKFKKIFQLMRCHGCVCVKINPNASDFTNYKLPLRKRYKQFGIKNALSDFTQPFRSYINDLIHGNIYSIYSYYISSGNNPKIDIHINQQDWEKAFSTTDSEPIVSYKYGVFCDEYFPEHPDFNYIGGFRNIGEIKDKYRREINKFFNYLETKYSVRMVVAAHPKSNYHGDEFGGREIIRGNTMELVKNAEFSIVHGSMSISYSVIFNKPIILAITDEMMKLYCYQWQSYIYSYYFGLNVTNLSRGLEATPELVTADIRNKYIYEFLTSPGIEDKKNADILADTFSKM